MKKLVTRLRKTFSKVIPDESLLNDNISVEEFRATIKDNVFNFSQAKINDEKKLLKEKLFCLNCYRLYISENHKLIKNLLLAMFEGNYELKMSEEQAISFYEVLDFASRIFIQERNRSIKKLFQ